MNNSTESAAPWEDIYEEITQGRNYSGPWDDAEKSVLFVKLKRLSFVGICVFSGSCLIVFSLLNFSLL